MEVRHLKLVKTVSEEGSLTGAGKRLFLSQSALSHQLREVEEKLGAALFQRVNKKMILTEVGRRVLQTANLVLCELEKAETDVRKYIDGDAGLLRISTECYTVYHWLPPILSSYSKHFPKVEIQIVAEATRQPKEYLLQGKLDLAIISCLTKSEDYGPCEFTELFTDNLVVVTSADHPLAQKETIDASDFSKEHLICYTAPIAVLDVFQRVLIPEGIKPRRVTHMQLSEAIVEMVKANLGITVMANWAIKPYLRSKKLVTIPFTNHAIRRTWYAVTLKSNHQPQFITCFVDHMLRHPIAGDSRPCG